MELGAITAKLRIELGDFLAGLKRAQAANQDYQRAFAQANATATQSSRAVSETLKRVAADSRTVAQAAQSAGGALSTTAKASEAAWGGLLERLRSGSREADAWGAHTQQAGEQGAHGVASLSREVLGTAKSFALAQLGVGSLEQALEGVKRFYEGVIEVNAEAETNALRYAEAMRRSGQAGRRSLEELIEEWGKVENASEDAARTVGVSASQFQFFVTKAVGAGLQWQNAITLVQTLSVALRNATGPTERLGAAFQTMMALLRGDVEQADLLIRQLGAGGRDAVVEISRALAQGDFPKAIALLNERLGITVELNQRHAASWRGVQQAAENAWEEVRKGKDAKGLMTELSKLVERATSDLEHQGVLWHLTKGAIVTANDGVRLLNATLEGANERLKEMHRGPLGDILTRMQAINEAAFAWMRANLPEWLLSSQILTPPAPPHAPGAETGTATATGTTPTRPTIPTAEDIRLREAALQTLTLEQQKQLDLAQQRGRVAIASAEASQNETELARVRTAVEQQQLALRRQQLGVVLQQKSQLLGLVSALKGATDSQAISLAHDIEQLEAERASLAVQGQAVGLEGQRAQLLARLAAVQADAQRAAQVEGAQGERRLAQLQTQRATLADIARAQGEITDLRLREEAQGLQEALALLHQQFTQAQLSTHEAYKNLVALQEQNRARQDANRLLTAQNVLAAQVSVAVVQQRAQYDETLAVLQGQTQALQIQQALQESQVRLDLLTPLQEQYQLGQLTLTTKAQQLALERQSLEAQGQLNALKYVEAIANAKNATEQTAAQLAYNLHVRQQGIALDLNRQNTEALAAGRAELERMATLAQDRALAQGLSEAAHNFIDHLIEGKADMTALVQDVAKAFARTLDEELNRAINDLVKGLRQLLEQAFSGGGGGGLGGLASTVGGWLGLGGKGGGGGLEADLGDWMDAFVLGQTEQEPLEWMTQQASQAASQWAGMAMAGIGAAIGGITSLFKDTGARVEALGASAKQQISRSQETRGLVAGDTSIAVAALSQNLSQAMRPSETWLASIDRRLQAIAGALNASQGTAPAPATFGVSVETLSSARV